MLRLSMVIRHSGISKPTENGSPGLHQQADGARRLWIVLNRLSILVIFGFVNLVTACAQSPSPAQRATTQVMCAGQVYDLTIVSANAILKNQDSARALGIGLSPKGEPPSKVFCVYWVGDRSASPTSRDDTNGTAAVKPYNNGKLSSGNGIFEDFLTTQTKCPPDNSPISAILAEVKNARSDTSLDQIKGALSSQGVTLDIQDAKAEEQNGFAGLTDATGFARAVHQYAASESQGGNGTFEALNEKIKKLEAEKIELGKKVEELANQAKAVQSAQKGNTSLWWWLLLPLALAAGAVAQYSYSRWQKKRVVPSAQDGGDQTKPAGTGGLKDVIQEWYIRYQALSSIYEKAIHAKPAQSSNGKRYEEMLFNAIKYSSNYPKEQKQKLYDYFSLGRQYLDALLNLCDDLYHQAQNYPASDSSAQSLERRDGDTQDDLQSASRSQAEAQMANPHHEKLTEMISDLQVSFTESLKQLKEGQKEQHVTLQQINSQVQTSSLIQETLQVCWKLLRNDAYNKADTPWLLGKIEEALKFCHFLGGQLGSQNLDIATMRSDIIHLKEKLEGIRGQYLGERASKHATMEQVVDAVKIKLQEDSGTLKKVDAANASLNGEDVFKALPRLLSEHKDSLKTLNQYVPSASGLLEAVRMVDEQYKTIAGEVTEALPEAQGLVIERVGLLAAGYLDQKKQRVQAEAERTGARTLAKEIAVQLHFNVDQLDRATDPIELLRRHLSKEKQADIYQQLRMGLSAALIALLKAQQINRTAEQQLVNDALYVQSICQGLIKLLDEMERYLEDEEAPIDGNSGAPASSSPSEESKNNRYKQRLWEKGLYNALNDQWLHWLFRADLLLRTYFLERKEVAFLQEAVSLANSATRAALYELGVEVVRIRLFEPLPEGMPTEPVYPNLRALSVVREKILKELDYRSGFIIDVTSFPIRASGRSINPGRAVPVNPSTWLQN